MPPYRIERQLDGALTEEIDAAAFRAIGRAPIFPDLSWVRSFYDPAASRLTCYCEAASAEDIRKHSEMARIPCDSVAEVVEYLPDCDR